MPGQKCTVCGNTQENDPTAKFHRLPSEKKHPIARAEWMSVFNFRDEDVKPSTRICSRHFPGGDSKKTPSTTLGKQFVFSVAQSIVIFSNNLALPDPTEMLVFMAYPILSQPATEVFTLRQALLLSA